VMLDTDKTIRWTQSKLTWIAYLNWICDCVVERIERTVSTIHELMDFIHKRLSNSIAAIVACFKNAASLRMVVSVCRITMNIDKAVVFG
jgi:hypothetical protein